MVKRSEGYFSGSLKPSLGLLPERDLFYQIWEPNTAAVRGHLILTHGICEHSDAYEVSADRLAQLGFAVYAHDLRGHGRSEGKRGVIDSFARFRSDLGQFIDMLMRGPLKGAKAPIALIGHSMGGLITADFLQNELVPRQIAAVILSSPAFGVAMPISALKLKLGEFLLRFAPEITLPADIPYRGLVGTKDVTESYKSDPLRHEKVSPRLFFEMNDTYRSALGKAGEIQIPCLIVASAKDQIVSVERTLDFFDRLASATKQIQLYDRSEHEVLNDGQAEDVFQRIVSFMDDLKGVSTT